MHKTAIISLPV